MTGLKKPYAAAAAFTLVELVVVLVIAGITASFAVPALTGYIDNAKGEAGRQRDTGMCDGGDPHCRAEVRLGAERFNNRKKAMVQML